MPRDQLVVKPSLSAASLAMLRKNAVISEVDSPVVVASSPSSNVARTLVSQPLSCIAEPPTAIAIVARIIRIQSEFRFIILLLHAANSAGPYCESNVLTRRSNPASASRRNVDIGLSYNPLMSYRFVVPIGAAAVMV